MTYTVIDPSKMVTGQPEDISVVLANLQSIQFYMGLLAHGEVQQPGGTWTDSGFGEWWIDLASFAGAQGKDPYGLWVVDAYDEGPLVPGGGTTFPYCIGTALVLATAETVSAGSRRAAKIISQANLSTLSADITTATFTIQSNDSTNTKIRCTTTSATTHNCSMTARRFVGAA